MKNYQIDTDSALFKFCDKFCTIRASSIESICDYRAVIIKAVMMFSMLSVIVIAAITVISAVLVQMVLGIVFGFIYGFSIVSEIAVVGYIITATIVSYISIVALITFVQNKSRDINRNRELSNKQPSILIQSYRSWKDKVCTKVEFVGSNAHYYTRDE